MYVGDFEERLELLWQDFGGGPMWPLPFEDQISRQENLLTVLLYYYVPVDGFGPLVLKGSGHSGFNECQQYAKTAGLNFTSGRLRSVSFTRSAESVYIVPDDVHLEPFVPVPEARRAAKA